MGASAEKGAQQDMRRHVTAPQPGKPAR